MSELAPSASVPRDLPRLAADLGVATLIVKAGAQGSYVTSARDRQTVHVPAALDVVVLDATGAGDAFDGSAVAALASGSDAVTAAITGSVSAAFVVGSRGIQLPPSAWPDDRLALVNQLREGVSRT